MPKNLLNPNFNKIKKIVADIALWITIFILFIIGISIIGALWIFVILTTTTIVIFNLIFQLLSKKNLDN